MKSSLGFDIDESELMPTGKPKVVMKSSLGFDITEDDFTQEMITPPISDTVIPEERGIADKIKEGLSTITQVPEATGRGLLEGITTELPSMVGKSLEYIGVDTGKGIADWAEEKKKEWYGDTPEYKGIAGIAYEGSKMLAPSLIPAGTVGTVARLGLAGVKSLNAIRKARIATNIASLGAAGMFGTSTAQQVKDVAKERGVDAGYAPEIEGAIEALGEFVGTKYLGKMLGLDKGALKVTLKNFIKTLGVETSTEFLQQLGQSATDKAQGIRPEANPFDEAISVIGPTAFMTALTGGAGKVSEGIAGKVSKPSDLTSGIGEQEDIKSRVMPPVDLTKEPVAKEPITPAEPAEAGEAEKSAQVFERELGELERLRKSPEGLLLLNEELKKAEEAGNQARIQTIHDMIARTQAEAEEIVEKPELKQKSRMAIEVDGKMKPITRQVADDIFETEDGKWYSQEGVEVKKSYRHGEMITKGLKSLNYTDDQISKLSPADAIKIFNDKVFAKKPAEQPIIESQDVKETKILKPTDRINDITISEATKRLAEGDKTVLPDIKEGVKKFGLPTMQHIIRNDIIAKIQKIQDEQGIPYQEAVKKYREIEPDVDKILNEEEVEPPIFKQAEERVKQAEQAQAQVPDVKPIGEKVGKSLGAIEDENRRVSAELIDKGEGILDINPTPRNIRGKTSAGNWAVDYEVPSSLGKTGKQQNTKYFWRKGDAVEWINLVKQKRVKQPELEEQIVPRINPYNEEISGILKVAREKLGAVVYNELEVIKTASKIAQLENSKEVKPEHVSEAIQYRGNAKDYLKYFEDDIESELSVVWGKEPSLEYTLKNYEPALERAEQVLGGDVKNKALKIVKDTYNKLYPEEVQRGGVSVSPPASQPYSINSRVLVKGSPQDYTITEVLEQSPVEIENDEQYYKIKSNKKGAKEPEIITVEKSDIKPIGFKEEKPKEHKDTLSWVKGKGGINLLKSYERRGELLQTRETLNQGKKMGVGNQIVNLKGVPLDNLTRMALDEGIISQYEYDEKGADALIDAIESNRKLSWGEEDFIEDIPDYQMIAPHDLKEGDNLVIEGEKFKVKGFDNENNAILEDGQTIKLKPDDVIEVERFTRKGKPVQVEYDEGGFGEEPVKTEPLTLKTEEGRVTGEGGKGAVQKGLFEKNRFMEKMTPEEARKSAEGLGEGDEATKPIWVVDKSLVDTMTANLELNKEQIIKILQRDVLNQDPTGTIINELFQNSLDAFPENMPISERTIDIKEDDSVAGSKTITFSDNGQGMSSEEVKKNFLTLGNVAKTEGQRGGYGFAKVSFLIYPDKVKLTTIRDGKLTKFEATNDDLIRGSIPIISGNTDSPNGTTLEMVFQGDKQSELNSFSYRLENYINSLKTEVNITYLNTYGGEKTYKPIDFKDIKSIIPPVKVDFEGNEIELKIQKTEKYSSWFKPVAIRTTVFNKGLKLQHINLSKWLSRLDPDYEILINFIKTPLTINDKYPFVKNRTEITKPVIDAIDKTLGTYIKDLEEGRFQKTVSDLKAEIEGAIRINGIRLLNPFKNNKENVDKIFQNNPGIFNDITSIFNQFNKIIKRITDTSTEIAVTVDPGVHGLRYNVNLGLPDLIAYNPFSISNKLLETPVYKDAIERGVSQFEIQASNLVHTLVHEYAHIAESGHSEGFSGQINRLYSVLSHKELSNLEGVAYELFRKYSEQIEVIQKHLEEYKTQEPQQTDLSAVSKSTSGIKELQQHRGEGIDREHVKEGGGVGGAGLGSLGAGELQRIYERIASYIEQGKHKEAFDDLVIAGTQFYSDGAKTFTEFRLKMKKWAGDLFPKIGNQLLKVYHTVKKVYQSTVGKGILSIEDVSKGKYLKESPIKENTDGSITVIDFNAIKKAEWSKINTSMKQKGYDWRGADDTRKLMENLQERTGKLTGDHANAIKTVLQVREQMESQGGKIIQQAIKEYGTTSDFREAGFIFPDGRMLDLSGKREGGEKGHRALDHREVSHLVEYEGDSPTGGMWEFSRQTGAIRFSATDNGKSLAIDITGRPNSIQIRKILNVINRDTELNLDYTDPVSGDVIDTLEADGLQAKRKMVDFLNKHFQKGGTPVLFDITSAFNPEFIISNLRELKGDVQKAMPYLIDLGRGVYEGGAKTFTEFRTGMKQHLDDMWDSFKRVMLKVYNNVKKAIKAAYEAIPQSEKAKMQTGSERGIIKQYEESEIEPKESTPGYEAFMEDVGQPDRRGLSKTWATPVRMRNISAQVLKRIGRLFGKQVEFFRINDPNIKINGAVTDKAPSHIFLNIDSQEPHLFVLGHELLHQLKIDSPENYKKFLSHINSEIKNLDQYREYKVQDRKLSLGEGFVSTPLAKEELLADFTGEQFLDNEFWNRLSEKDPTIFQKVVEIAKSIINKILTTFGENQNIISNKFFKDIKKSQVVLVDTMVEYAKRQKESGMRIEEEGVKFATGDRYQAKEKIVETTDRLKQSSDERKEQILNFASKLTGETGYGFKKLVNIVQSPFWDKDLRPLVKAMNRLNRESSAITFKTREALQSLKQGVSIELKKALIASDMNGKLTGYDELSDSDKAKYDTIRETLDWIHKEKLKDYFIENEMYKLESKGEEVSDEDMQAIFEKADNFIKEHSTPEYFPRFRFEEYALVIKKNGKTVHFETFASPRERAIAEKALTEEFRKPKDTKLNQFLKELGIPADSQDVSSDSFRMSERYKDPKGVLYAIQNMHILKNIVKDDAEVKDLSEFLGEEFLKIWARGRIAHRKWKTVTGYETDIVKALNTYIESFPRSMVRRFNTAKLEDMVKEVPEAKRYLARSAVDYFAGRIDREGVVNHTIRSAIYNMYLGLKPAFGVLNLMQRIQTTLPKAIQETGDTTKALGILKDAQGKELGYYGHQIANRLGSYEAIESYGKFSDLEKGIIKRLFEENELAAVRGNEIVGKSKLGRALGIFANLSEKSNRLMTAITAIEIGNQKGLKSEELYNYTLDFLHKTQFLYGKENRPIITRGKLAPLTVFKSFVINDINFLKDLYPNKKAFSIAVATRLALSGIGGLYGMNVITALVNSIMRGLDDDWDLDKEDVKRKYLPIWLRQGLPSLMGISGTAMFGSAELFGIAGIPYGEAVSDTVSEYIEYGSVDKRAWRRLLPSQVKHLLTQNLKERFNEVDIDRLPKEVRKRAKVLWKDVPTEQQTLEKFLDVLGFATATPSEFYETVKSIKEASRHIKGVKSRYHKDIAQAIVGKDFERVKELKKEAKERGIKLNRASIRRYKKEMLMLKREE